MRKDGTSAPGSLRKSAEDYLEAILILHHRKGEVRSVDVADFLNFSRPSVCNAVAALCQSGYLVMDADHYLSLTDSGKAVAERIYERHRFFTELLEASGVDHDKAEADACKLEHDISPESFEQLKRALTARS